MDETETEITYNDIKWGKAVTYEESNNIIIDICGEYIDSSIFRAYGVSDDNKKVILIGVLEPLQNTMKVKKRFTKTYLKSCGFYPDLPQKFIVSQNKLNEISLIDEKPNLDYLENNDINYGNTEFDITTKTKKTVPKTKDILINNALKDKFIEWELIGNLLNIYCEFNKNKEFPLSFVFSVCTIEKRENGMVACYRCWI